MQITRSLEFDTAHRLLNHEGKCRSLHGHRYKLEVGVRGEHLDDVGRILDFGRIKTVLGERLDTVLDHNTILHHKDVALRDVLVAAHQETGTKYPILFYENPTAEHMADFLLCYSRWLFRHSPGYINSVTLWETPNCAATFHDCTYTEPAHYLFGKTTQALFLDV